MLDFLRRKAQSPALQVTILVIIVVFVFWGTNMGSGSRRDSVAMVNDEAISFGDFNQEYSRSLDQLREQFGGGLPKGLLEGLDLKNQVLQRLIQRTLLLQGAEEMGLYVSDWEVQQQVQKQLAFHKDGAFDYERYKQVLDRNRLTQKTYEAGLRHDLLSQKVSRELATFARLDQWEIDQRQTFNNQEFRLNYATFTPEQFKAKVEVADEALASWFNDHKQRYQSKPKVKLDYLAFQKKEYLAEISIADSEAQSYYERSLEKYQVAETRRASHILLRPEEGKDLKAEMAAIQARLKAGEDFATLAHQLSQDPGSARQGGDLGFFGRGQMVPAFEQAVFSLQPGEVSPIVETQFGLHLVKLTEIKEATTTPFAQVKEQIISSLQDDQANSRAYEVAGETLAQIFQAGSLANYSKQQQLELQHTDFFEQGQPPADLKEQTALVSKAFTLAKGELSSLLEIPGGYAIIFVNDRLEPQVPPFEEVAAQAQADYVEEQASLAAKQAADAVLAQLKEGAEFSTSLEEYGIELQTSPFYSRRTPYSAGLPQELASSSFALHEKKRFPEDVFSQGNSHYVYALLELKQNEVAGNDRQQSALKASLLREKQASLIDNWLTFLLKKSTITTNQKFLDQHS